MQNLLLSLINKEGMRHPETSNRFHKDYKRCLKRGWDINKLKKIAILIEANKTLPVACRLHKLGGTYSGYWECHVAPDWLLIYYLDDEKDTVTYERTGTHADLFE